MMESLRVGDRIRLVSMPDDPDPVTVGQTGTVRGIYPQGRWHQVDVDWDNGRSLLLVVPPDRFEVIARAEAPENRGYL